MDSVAQIAEILQTVFGEQAESLAQQTGFIKRYRAGKVTGANFAMSMVFGWLQQATISVDGLTQVMQRCEVDISASGLSQRFTPEAGVFMNQMLEQLTQYHLQGQRPETALLKPFSAVIIEDSSTVTLPAELASIWKGCGGTGCNSGASMKIFVRWDVLRGELMGPRFAEGRTNDHKSPFADVELPAGSLYLSDLGFFGVRKLAALDHGMVGRKRYFVSRLHPGTWVTTASGHHLDLKAIGPKEVGEMIDLGVRLGKHEQMPVRLIMLRVPEEAVKERRQAIREAAQSQGRVASEALLVLAKWTIVVSNIPRHLVSTQEMVVLLRLRWQIERLFRLWKEYGYIDEWRTKNRWRIVCEIAAKLCAMVIQQWLIHEGCWYDAQRSVFKAAGVVRREANRIMVALIEGGLIKVLQAIRRAMKSGCRLQKRVKEPSTAQLLESGLNWPVQVWMDDAQEWA